MPTIVHHQSSDSSAVSSERIEKENSAVEALLEQGFLEAAGVSRFSLCFNPEKDGVLRLNPPVSTSKLASIGTYHWGLDFRGISVGNAAAEVQFCKASEKTSEEQTTACGIIPDSGTTVMMASKEHLISLFTQICQGWERCRQNATKGLAPHVSFQLLLADCSSWAIDNSSMEELPSIFFHVAGADGQEQTVEMTAHDYIMESFEEDVQYITKYLLGVYPMTVEQPTGSRQRVCTPAFGQTDFMTKNNGPVWIWGTPLFYKFQVQYDISESPPSMSLVNMPCGTCEDSHSLLATDRQDIDRSAGRRLRQLKGPLRLPSFNLTTPFL